MWWCVLAEAGRPFQATCRSTTPAEGADPPAGRRSAGTKPSRAKLGAAHLTATWWSGPITVPRSSLAQQEKQEKLWASIAWAVSPNTNKLHARLFIDHESIRASVAGMFDRKSGGPERFFLLWHSVRNDESLSLSLLWCERLPVFYVVMTMTDKYLSFTVKHSSGLRDHENVTAMLQVFLFFKHCWP